MTNQPIGPDHQLPESTKPKRSTGVRIVVWIVILLIFAGAFTLILRHKDTAATLSSRRNLGGTVTVTTATATKGDIGVYIDAIGTVTPVYTASITSEVTGVITAVN